MHAILLHEATFSRLESRLNPYLEKISPVILHNDGIFRDIQGKPLDTCTHVRIAYGTPDVWFSKIALNFVETCLGADHLAWFQSSAAGIEHPVLQSLRSKAIVYTASHEQSDAIAEWVLWSGLDWFQAGPARRAAQAQKTWKRIEFTEIADTHWLIVGFGAIGQATARLLRKLGAKVTGVRRTSGLHPDADHMIQPNQLHAHLGTADAVLLSCPLTAETHGMADKDFFSAMKPGSLFTNVGRGLLVDETAMLASLDREHLGYAALDVVAVEPLPADNPIWAHPKITLTSHLAADTMGSARRTDSLFMDNLDRFLNDRPLRNMISETPDTDHT